MNVRINGRLVFQWTELGSSSGSNEELILDYNKNVKYLIHTNIIDWMKK